MRTRVAARRCVQSIPTSHPNPMKRLWLVFAQTVTVVLAAYFVVATLQPEWLDRKPSLAAVVPVLESGNQ